MRSIHNYVQAVKARREENGDESGFSLIELIVVVVILGVLAAVAIPIFLNIQNQANENALKSVAANGATQASAAFAQNKTYVAAGATDDDEFDLLNLGEAGPPAITVSLISGSAADLDAICVGASRGGSTTVGIDYQTAGPGCP